MVFEVTLAGRRLGVWMVEELTAVVTWLNQQGVSISRGEGRKTSLVALPFPGAQRRRPAAVTMEGRTRQRCADSKTACRTCCWLAGNEGIRALYI